MSKSPHPATDAAVEAAIGRVLASERAAADPCGASSRGQSFGAL